GNGQAPRHRESAEGDRRRGADARRARRHCRLESRGALPRDSRASHPRRRERSAADDHRPGRGKGGEMKSLLPPGWPRPKGYSNGMAARGRIIVTSGVVGWDANEHFVSNTLAGQFAQALRNILAILECDGAGPENLARLTCYVTSIDEYLASLKEIGAAWKEIIGP